MALIPVRPASAQGTVDPFLDCVRFDPVANAVTALFGYVSTHATPVTVPLEQNFFSPGDPNRGQPFEFLPGFHPRIFATSFIVDSQTPQLVWELNGISVLAQNDPATYCENSGARAFTSGVLTFPKGGVLTVMDLIVTPSSVIVVQYVGPRAGSVPVITNVETGQFTVRGSNGKQFRYVVFE